MREVYKILGFIPFVPFACWLLMILIGVFHFGSFPVYSVHPDPYSLGIDWLNGVSLIFILISLLTMPVWLFATTQLLLDKAKFSRTEIAGALATIVSVSVFFVLRFGLTDMFYWIVD